MIQKQFPLFFFFFLYLLCSYSIKSLPILIMNVFDEIIVGDGNGLHITHIGSTHIPSSTIYF